MNRMPNTRGSISVFLLLIFMSNYVLAGVLVDGGRARLAAMTAESALDQATQSALTYYDNLLFDMYGLFAMEQGGLSGVPAGDAAVQEQLEQLLRTYMERTLGIAAPPGGSGEPQLIAGQLVGSVFDGYDFRIEQLNVAGNLNLSQTAITHYQLIEHMKYRAPLQIAAEVGDFVSQLTSLLEFRDQLEAIQKAVQQLDEKAKTFFEEAADVLKQAGAYRDRIGVFAVNPTAPQVTHPDSGVLAGLPKPNAQNTNTKNVWDYVRAYDDNVRDIFNTPAEEEETFEERAEAVMEELERNRDDLENKWNTMVGASQYLDATREVLRDSLLVLVERGNAIRDEMKAEIQNDENTRLTLEPIIAELESVIGELSMYLDIVRRSQLSTNLADIAYRIPKIDQAAGAVLTTIEWGNTESELSLQEKLLWGNDYFGMGEQFINDVNEKLQRLGDTYNRYREREIVDEEDTRQSEADRTVPPITNDDRLPLINANDIALAVDHGSPSPGQMEQLLQSMNAGQLTFGNIVGIIDRLLSLFDELLAAFIADSRDNIYINEYILGNFRNYVHHAATVDRPLPAGEGERPLAAHLLAPEYENKYHTAAEIEYILAGKLSSIDNVNDIRTRILTMRLVLNLIAIFLEKDKVAIANQLAAPAGLFTPLVAVVILVAWASAESVLDVEMIMQGKEVALFKWNATWEISAENLVEKAVAHLRSFLGNAVKEQIELMVGGLADRYFASFEKHVQRTVYAFYDSVDSTVAQFRSRLEETRQLMNAQSPAMSNVNDAFIQLLNAVLNDIPAGSSREEVMEQIGTAMAAVRQQKDAILNHYADQFSETAVGSFAADLPIGGTDSSAPLPSYQAADGIAFGYNDYLRLFLFFMPNEKKVQRIQEVVQLNMRAAHGDLGNNEPAGAGYRMNKAYVNVAADAQVSIKFLFVTSVFLPEDVRKSGRLVLKAQSNRAY